MRIIKKLARWYLKVFPDIFIFELRIPFFQIRTHLMQRCYDRNIFRYIAFEVKIWGYNFYIDLGDTYAKLYEEGL